MYIEDKFLTSEFKNPNSHLKDMLKETLKVMEYKSQYTNPPNGLSYYDSVDTYKIIMDFCIEYNIDFELMDINENTTTLEILKYLKKFYAGFTNKSHNMYQDVFSRKKYNLTDTEYKTIQDKINKLRDILIDTELFDEKHRERILKKLEELQNELHQKMSSFDKFLGGMVSVAHTLGLSAKEAKPFTNEVKDILDITLNAKSRGEDLPESNNQIESNNVLQIEDI